MSRELAIVLGSVALLVGTLASVALTVELFSILVRPVSFSLRFGKHSVDFPQLHWSVYTAAVCVAVIAVVLLWPIVFPTRPRPRHHHRN